MTTEKILEKLYSILHTMPTEEQQKAEKIINDPQEWTISEPVVILSELIKELREDIANETAAKSGKKNVRAAALRILKRGKNTWNNALSYAYTAPDGKQIICDGYSLVQLFEPLQLPKLPTTIQPIDYTKIIPAVIPAENIDLPDRAKLQAYIKLCKAEKKTDSKKRVYYYFGGDFPIVDAENLFDIMECMPDAANATCINSYKPLYIQSENAFGMLLPLKVENPSRERTKI